MPIYLIASFTYKKNEFLIGQNGDLICSIPEDLTRFYNLTKHTIVVMGSKTYESLPQKPLKNRLNIVLTRQNSVNDLNSLDDSTMGMYTTSFEKFKAIYKNQKNQPKVFVIGGGEIYDLFLNDPELYPEKLFLTQLFLDLTEPNEYVCYTTMPKPSHNYTLKESSDLFTWDSKSVQYRFLTYEYSTLPHEEFKYLDLCKDVLENGILRGDRTNIGTKSLFGKSLMFNIRNSIPLLTTKRVAWKHCIEELLWFLRGDTDARILQKKGVRIWNGNSSREFLDHRGLTYQEGVLGPIYSWQWRFYGAEYDEKYADTNIATPEGGVDQIELLIQQLRENPFSRRHVISAWNPKDLPKMALPPCHHTFQFYVEEINQDKFLNCHFMMRSNDLGCGTSFNLLSYTLLTYLIAMKVNMKPNQLFYTCTDAHIYLTHIEALKEQCSRKPRPFPKLKINPEVVDKKWNEIQVSDFEIIGYFPEPSIRMDMAI
jgi:dihydrofolate reductase/thymidylate synthase